MPVAVEDVYVYKRVTKEGELRKGVTPNTVWTALVPLSAGSGGKRRYRQFYGPSARVVNAKVWEWDQNGGQEGEEKEQDDDRPRLRYHRKQKKSSDPVSMLPVGAWLTKWAREQPDSRWDIRRQADAKALIRCYIAGPSKLQLPPAAQSRSRR